MEVVAQLMFATFDATNHNRKRSVIEYVIVINIHTETDK